MNRNERMICCRGSVLGRASWVAMLMAAAWGLGCARAPQIEMPNRRLVESLKTAVMANNTEWLAQNVTAIDERRAAGKMSDAEYEAFQAVIAEARAGEWAAAAKRIQQLSDGQEWSP